MFFPCEQHTIRPLILGVSVHNVVWCFWCGTYSRVEYWVDRGSSKFWKINCLDNTIEFERFGEIGPGFCQIRYIIYNAASK